MAERREVAYRVQQRPYRQTPQAAAEDHAGQRGEKTAVENEPAAQYDAPAQASGEQRVLDDGDDPRPGQSQGHGQDEQGAIARVSGPSGQFAVYAPAHRPKSEQPQQGIAGFQEDEHVEPGGPGQEKGEETAHGGGSAKRKGLLVAARTAATRALEARAAHAQAAARRQLAGGDVAGGVGIGGIGRLGGRAGNGEQRAGERQAQGAKQQRQAIHEILRDTTDRTLRQARIGCNAGFASDSGRCRGVVFPVT